MVIPEWRGADSGEIEKGTIKRKLSRMLGEDVTPKGGPGKLVKRHVANKLALLAKEHAMLMGTGLCFKTFEVQDPFKGFHIDERCDVVPMERAPPDVRELYRGRDHVLYITNLKTGRCRLAVPRNACRKLIVDVLDMGSIGWPLTYFLYYNLPIRGVAQFDFSHRRNINVEASLADSGLSCCRYEMVLVLNLGSAPFKSCGHFNKYREAADEVFSHSEFDALWDYFFPSIAHDFCGGRFPADYGTRGFRESVKEWARNHGMWEHKGEKTELNRWCQWAQRWRRFSSPSLLMMVITYVGIVLGWWNSFDDLKALFEGTQLENKVLGKHFHVSDAAAPSSRAVSGSSAVNHFFGKNSIYVAAEILADGARIILFTGITYLCQPVEIELNNTIKNMKSRDAARDWWIKMGKGFCGVVQEILERLTSKRILQLTGLDKHFRAPCSVQFYWTIREDKRAQCSVNLLNFAASLMAREATFSMWFHCALPGRFMALLSDDPQVVAEALDYLRRSWDAAWQLQTLAVGDVKFQHALETVLFSHNIWCMEILCGLREASWSSVPDDIRRELSEFAMAVTGTKDVEDCFNLVRRLQRTNPASKMSRSAQWHAVIHGGIAEDAGKRQVTSLPEDRIQGASQLHDSVFTPYGTDFSFGEASMRSYMQEQKPWPHPTPAHMLLAARNLSQLIRAVAEFAAHCPASNCLPGASMQDCRNTGRKQETLGRHDILDSSMHAFLDTGQLFFVHIEAASR